MKGQYKTKDQETVQVLEFDAANKMVRISAGWVGEPEYATWVKLTDETEDAFSGEPELILPEEVIFEHKVSEDIEEVPLKKASKEPKKEEPKKKK